MESSDKTEEFDNEETCFVCQTEQKELKTKSRNNLPVKKVHDTNEVQLQSEIWKKSE